MKHFLSVTLLLLAALPSWAQSVKLPTEVKVPVGRLAAVAVEYDGDDIRWVAPEQLDCFREYDPDSKKVRLRLIGYAAGQYQFYAVTCKAGKLSDFAACKVTVGDQPPPGPNPPTPPVPPGPPADPLAQSVVAAWASETDAAKVPQVALLAALFRNAASPNGVVNDPGVKTNAELLAILHKAAGTLIPDAALPKVRRAVADYLNATLGTSAASAVDRAKAGAAFSHIADVLGGLK